jgi:hypothetical protein
MHPIWKEDAPDFQRKKYLYSAREVRDISGLRRTQVFVGEQKKPPLIRSGFFYLLSEEAISRFLLHKDLLTLDLKYYEKNSVTNVEIFLNFNPLFL